MNKVGADGKGESVWNGWFCSPPCATFADLADRRGDDARAAWCRERADALRAAAGGTRLGRRAGTGAPTSTTAPRSARRQNDECQIDSLAQSWAVISGAADPERARQAMAAVEQRLVRPDGRADPALHAARSTGGTSSRATSRATCPAFARTAASTRTPPPGWCWRRRCWARASGQWSCSTCSTRSATPPLPTEVERYKVEPYVVCADVYGAPPHTGRGGWTWYTGSAGWLYRVGLEAILGFRLRGDRLRARSVRPARLVRLRDHLPLPLGDLPHHCGEPRGLRSRGPKRDGRWSRGAGGRGRTGGRRRTAQGPDCARIVT